MNHNVSGYIIFLIIMTYVVVVVGWKLYILGRPFLVKQFVGELHLVDPINKLLLLGYYLFNLGYVVLSVQQWKQLQNMMDVINMVANKSGTIILMLGIMHYFNMFWISKFHIILNKIGLKI